MDKPIFIMFDRTVQPDHGLGKILITVALPYEVTQTMRRGETALTRDELEALITAHNGSQRKIFSQRNFDQPVFAAG